MSFSGCAPIFPIFRSASRTFRVLGSTKSFIASISSDRLRFDTYQKSLIIPCRQRLERVAEAFGLRLRIAWASS